MSVLSLSSLTSEPKACKHSSADKYKTMFITKANENTGECLFVFVCGVSEDSSFVSGRGPSSRGPAVIVSRA